MVRTDSPSRSGPAPGATALPAHPDAAAGVAARPDLDSGRFFVVGPLRTGSSLLARCLDDHPGAICLCESEINRALFRDYYLLHHCRRMVAHGLTIEEAVGALNRTPQEDIAGLERWYALVGPHLAGLYGKPAGARVGDKSPDYFRSPALVAYLAATHPLIYGVRDPRAIFHSISGQADSDEPQKAERWSFLFENFLAWEQHLDRPNVLVVRYEDLITAPETTMARAYAHVGLADSPRFLTPFVRPHPRRFLWRTAIDWETGIRRDFDAGRVDAWRRAVPGPLLRQVEADPRVARFMDRFGYEV